MFNVYAAIASFDKLSPTSLWARACQGRSSRGRVPRPFCISLRQEMGSGYDCVLLMYLQPHCQHNHTHNISRPPFSFLYVSSRGQGRVSLSASREKEQKEESRAIPATYASPPHPEPTKIRLTKRTMRYHLPSITANTTLLVKKKRRTTKQQIGIFVRAPGESSLKIKNSLTKIQNKQSS